MQTGEETVATPLLSVDVRDTQDLPDDDDDDEDEEEDEPCSFEEILLANNITLGSTPDLDLDHNSKYNIVSDLEDDYPEPTNNKISNVPSSVEDNRLGSPRSRRPFLRTDYSRVSDVSFLSALEEEGVDDSLSELQDSDWEPDNNKPSDQTTAKLIQTSLSEVYL